MKSDPKPNVGRTKGIVLSRTRSNARCARAKAINISAADVNGLKEGSSECRDLIGFGHGQHRPVGDHCVEPN